MAVGYAEHDETFPVGSGEFVVGSLGLRIHVSGVDALARASNLRVELSGTTVMLLESTGDRSSPAKIRIYGFDERNCERLAVVLRKQSPATNWSLPRVLRCRMAGRSAAGWELAATPLRRGVAASSGSTSS